MKKYILKPGNHQFAPVSAAIHNNENLSDAEAAWYLERFPHIHSLFVKQAGKTVKPTSQRKRKKSISI